MGVFNEKLKARLKEKGLDLAEDVLVDITKAVFDATRDVIKDKPDWWDSPVIKALDLIEPKILEKLDKVDGVVGNLHTEPFSG